MRIENHKVCISSVENNCPLVLDPQQVNSLGAAFEEAWLQFTAVAVAGMDLFAEASIRQLIAMRIIRAARSEQFNRDALVAFALHGL